jgi:cobalamin 5'-phosphate synthase/cobalamin synthase
MLAAVMFLTRIRVPARARRITLGRATVWFPVVGAALGVAGAGIVRAAAYLPDVPPMLIAVLIVALGAWVTGAIHLDGLADAADGFGGGQTREDVLRIMRDPCVGSFGVIALVIVLASKTMAITTLVERSADASFLIAAPAVARWTVMPLSVWLPYARAGGGLGEALTRTQTRIGAAMGTALAVAITIAAAGAAAAVVWALAIVVTIAMGLQARRRIGGVTGDVFGACVELTETAVLVGAVLLT